MCGRFNLRIKPTVLQEYFDLLQTDEFTIRYNIAPTQDVVTIRVEHGQRIGVNCKWGLVPLWAKDTQGAAKLINARSETAAQKPSFRTAMKRRRCIIPMSGFYEWFRVDEQPRQTWHITSSDGNPLAVAGLWEVWHDGQADRTESCCVLTTEANCVMAPIHERMPCFLDRNDWSVWLDPEIQDSAAMTEMLRPCPDGWLQTAQVSNYVNNVRNQGLECISGE